MLPLFGILISLEHSPELEGKCKLVFDGLQCIFIYENTEEIPIRAYLLLFLSIYF